MCMVGQLTGWSLIKKLGSQRLKVDLFFACPLINTLFVEFRTFGSSVFN